MRNLLEDTIRSVYGELREQNRDLCDCERCEADVLALALSTTRPRYSGGADVGHALVTLELQRDQTRATIAVLVLEAMKKVAANPRHEVAGR